MKHGRLSGCLCVCVCACAQTCGFLTLIIQDGGTMTPAWAPSEHGSSIWCSMKHVTLLWNWRNRKHTHTRQACFAPHIYHVCTIKKRRELGPQDQLATYPERNLPLPLDSWDRLKIKVKVYKIYPNFTTDVTFSDLNWNLKKKQTNTILWMKITFQR